MITIDFARLDIRPGHKILDIGSGPGRHTGAAARFNGVTAIGADVSYPDITEAKRRLQFQEDVGECLGRWALLTTNILHLPFGDNAFDRVICAEVMEHISDHHGAASELVRVLKPGGVLAVSVPRYLPERICWLLSNEYVNTDNGHVRIYTKKQLKMLFENKGAALWTYHHAHSLHCPYWWLKCLMGPSRQDCHIVNLYHRFLVWDLMKTPSLTRWLDHFLNPLMGKSLVCYLRKRP